MKAYLASLIPWYALWFGFFLLVYSYTGEWPDLWVIPAALFFGFAWGARKLL